MARRKKVYDPAAATRAAIERAQQAAEAARLKAQGATVTVDRGGRIVSAFRSNVFNLLLQRGSITQNHHDAAHRLSLDWAAWKGLDGKPETFGTFVDGSCGCSEIVTDRMIRAGKEVAWLLAPLDETSRRLMCAFMVATVEEDRPMAWRGIVEREAGETRKDQQTGLVLTALEALRVVYEGPAVRRAA